jgi:acetyltransferase
MEDKTSDRESTLTIDSLRPLLQPRSIAIIGASRRQATIGNTLFHNILRQEFSGVVYPVNPNADAVASVKTAPTVLDIAGEVDLAIVIVPADGVNRVLEQCGQKGVRGIVVISAGFGEIGDEGRKKEEEILETCNRYRMRLVGPNCMGLINADPAVNMNATFSLIFPAFGNVALGTQSGALGLAILEYARDLNIGISTFVSLGNRADVSSNDLLQYWVEDQSTDVILLYLESFGNPRKFARIARNVALKKPIVVVKSGRTPAGSRAATSHTGALATAEVASEALFAQTGMIRVDTLQELFDVASMLSHQPLPRGRNVAILTNGGGPGILTADACAERGLELPSLSDRTLSGLKSFLSSRAGFSNPVDMTAEATAEEYSRALKLLAEDDGIDIAIVIFIPPIVTQAEAVAAAIRNVAPEYRRRNKVLVASFMGSRGVTFELGFEGECCVPSFAFPEDTATAIAKAVHYNEWLNKPKGGTVEMENIDANKAREVVISALKKNSTRPLWLDAESVAALLGAYGICLIQSKIAGSAAEAARAARDIGFPVAVKLVSDTIVHKTEVGGVVLDLWSEEEIEKAFTQIRQNLAGMNREGEMQGVSVQKMVSNGVEIIIGVTQDPSFGPLIMFGMGGIHAELFKDVTFRIHPLTDVDAREMVRSVKAYKLLEGWRGAKASDIPSLEELLLRISAMVEDLPEIEELDLNPVKVLEERKGYAVVDARVMLS